MHSALTTGMNTSCLGALERPRYFARQLITPAELNLEAVYFAERLRRHNRMLHGFGVVCGAKVCRVPAAEGGTAEPWKLRVTPGYAIDGYGNEISIDCERIFDLRASGLVVTSGDPEGELSDPWCSDVWVDRPPGRVWVAVCHKESLARPVRVQPAGCGCDDSLCEYSRWRDGYEIRLLDSCPPSHAGPPPTTEQFLDGLNGPLRECPACPDDPCVVLAAVDVDANGNVIAIDNCSCRRNVVSLADLWWRCAGGLVSITNVTPKDNTVPRGTESFALTVHGENLRADATIDLGPGVTVADEPTVSSTGKTLKFHVAVADDADLGERTLTITNPDCSLASWPRAVVVSPDA
jgi:hypothetical protein